MTRALTVVLHDVAPATWPAVERLRRCVRSVAPLPVTQLVVPRWHGQPQIYRSAYSEQALAELAQGLRREADAQRPAWFVLDNTALGHATGNAPISPVRSLSGTRSFTPPRRGRAS